MKTAALIAMIAVSVVAGELVVDFSNMTPTPVAMPAYPMTNKMVLYSDTMGSLIPATNSPSYSIESMREHGTTEIVKTLGENGEICKVYGHRLEEINTNIVYHWGKTSGRKCKCQVCGVVEMVIVEWK